MFDSDLLVGFGVGFLLFCLMYWFVLLDKCVSLLLLCVIVWVVFCCLGDVGFAVAML